MTTVEPALILTLIQTLILIWNQKKTKKKAERIKKQEKKARKERKKAEERARKKAKQVKKMLKQRGKKAKREAVPTTLNALPVLQCNALPVKLSPRL